MNTTTIKIRRTIAEARQAVLDAEQEFNVAWDFYDHTRSREARHAVNEANKKAVQLHKELEAQCKYEAVRQFGKLEGVQS